MKTCNQNHSVLSFEFITRRRERNPLHFTRAKSNLHQKQCSISFPLSRGSSSTRDFVVLGILILVFRIGKSPSHSSVIISAWERHRCLFLWIFSSVFENTTSKETQQFPRQREKVHKRPTEECVCSSFIHRPRFFVCVFIRLCVFASQCLRCWCHWVSM